jgi:hypothetical protein
MEFYMKNKYKTWFLLGETNQDLRRNDVYTTNKALAQTTYNNKNNTQLFNTCY